MNWILHSIADCFATGTIFIVIFYLLVIGSRMLDLYLRWIDALPIASEDIQGILRPLGLAIAWGVVALAFWALPFEMALASMSCVFLFYQLRRVSQRVGMLNKS